MEISIEKDVEVPVTGEDPGVVYATRTVGPSLDCWHFEAPIDIRLDISRLTIVFSIVFSAGRSSWTAPL